MKEIALILIVLLIFIYINIEILEDNPCSTLSRYPSLCNSDNFIDK